MSDSVSVRALDRASAANEPTSVRVDVALTPSDGMQRRGNGSEGEEHERLSLHGGEGLFTEDDKDQSEKGRGEAAESEATGKEAVGSESVVQAREESRRGGEELVRTVQELLDQRVPVLKQEICDALTQQFTPMFSRLLNPWIHGI